MPFQNNHRSSPSGHTSANVSYAAYKPTVEALLNAKKPLTIEEVSKITGRSPSLEAMAISNLKQANLLKQTKKYFKDTVYELWSIHSVYKHFNIERNETKEMISLQTD